MKEPNRLVADRRTNLAEELEAKCFRGQNRTIPDEGSEGKACSARNWQSSNWSRGGGAVYLVSKWNENLRIRAPALGYGRLSRKVRATQTTPAGQREKNESALPSVMLTCHATLRSAAEAGRNQGIGLRPRIRPR
jgi:hypothetical protein